MAIESLIENDLKLSSGFVQFAVNRARRYIKHIQIRKKNGSYRTASHPCNEAKVIQYWLIERLFKQMCINPAATAYIKGTSIRTNGEIHHQGQYFLKFDFRDFFPSITFADFELVLRPHLFKTPKITLTDTDFEIIRIICFDKEDRLTIGFPCSPIISNVVMAAFDQSFLSILEKNESAMGKCIYTRYADDMVISTNKKDVSTELAEIFRYFVRDWPTPKLILNEDKTRFMSRASGSVYFTGVRSCKDGHLTVHRKMKDRIRLYLALVQKDRLRQGDFSRLEGLLSYVSYVDPSFYTKLRQKYFNAFDKLAGR